MIEKTKQDAKALREISPDDCVDFPHVVHTMLYEAADLIESLSAELEQVKREREVAKHDLIPSCAICVHNRGFKKWDEECNACWGQSNWQWRGVREVET